MKSGGNLSEIWQPPLALFGSLWSGVQQLHANRYTSSCSNQVNKVSILSALARAHTRECVYVCVWGGGGERGGGGGRQAWMPASPGMTDLDLA